MNRKYELTYETIKINGHTLYRIKAIKNFGRIKKGALGGFIESEANLSHYEHSWIYKNSYVYDRAQVFGKAMVCGNAKIFDSASIYGSAWIYGNAQVYGNSKVCGHAQIHNSARVYGNAMVYGNAYVCGNAHLCGYANLHEFVKIDYGIWYNTIKIDQNKYVLVSSTLQKILLCGET